MENASKALIIAGSILVSILIIGLGVFIYQKAAGTVTKADLSSTEAQAQNQKFESYFGKNISSADVKQLLSLIRSNNITGSTNEESKTIAVSYLEGTTEKTPLTTSVNSISAQLKAGKTYTVGPTDDKAASDTTDIASLTATTINDKSGYYKSGFIRCIAVSLNSGSSSDTGASTTK